MKTMSADKSEMFATAGNDCTNVSTSVRKPREILMSLTSRRNRATLNASPMPLSLRVGTARSRNPAIATKKSTRFIGLRQYVFQLIAAMSRPASRM